MLNYLRINLVPVRINPCGNPFYSGSYKFIFRHVGGSIQTSFYEEDVLTNTLKFSARSGAFLPEVADLLGNNGVVADDIDAMFKGGPEDRNVYVTFYNIEHDKAS